MVFSRRLSVRYVLIASLGAMPAHAGQIPLIGGNESTRGLVDLTSRNGSLFNSPTKGAGINQASLFFDRNQGSFFAPFPKRTKPGKPLASAGLGFRKGVAGLRDLIAVAEAGSAGYDAVQHGARIRPGKKPTQMTIKEIFEWVRATPGQPHAIGRYQIIPDTMRYLTDALSVPETAVFSVQLQDQMANHLMRNAGLDAFLAGEMGKIAFMNNLAKIWAGLPTSKGQSYYHGYAGNYASISWAHFEAQMNKLFSKG